MGICKWWRNNSFQIYLSHILSSWSDRMWSFSIGLYLVILYPQSLQLNAIYGFSICVSVILFAPLIGKWIDKSRRIIAAQWALVIQNCSVIICCGLLISILHYSEELKSHLLLKNFGIGLIIVIAIIANLASEATKIALQKDWIVVLADGDEARLSKMNATMRSIDLTTFILAPIIVGQIITYVSQISGAAFIASWNLISGFFEYALLRLIYHRVPILAYKNIPTITIDAPSPDKSKSNLVELDNCKLDKSSATANVNISLTSLNMKTPRGTNDISYDNLSEINLITPSPSNNNLKLPNFKSNKIHPEPSIESSNILTNIFMNLKRKGEDTLGGWKDYFQHSVRFAGIGLALLYMTVLGFDHVTVGYAYSQGISESLVSIMTAFGALLGIMGSLAFPHLRNRFGKYATGNIGFGLETLCLLSCLVSVFAPGSPFTHVDAFHADKIQNNNFTNSSTVKSSAPTERTTLAYSEVFSTSQLSILLLMSGIIFARFGLWVADLSVLQFFQEEIPEDKRGILNGVQGALNQSMNLLKFLLVMILPRPETYGYLIFLSWIFVFMGWVSFMIFTFLHKRFNRCREQESGSASL